MERFDVVIIGGGTAGMMAAIGAASMGARTLVIEKNEDVGKKLLATGGGRCNVTNRRDIQDLIKHIPGNGRFLYSAFSEFDNYDIIDFFEARGVPLKEEDHGRIFPSNDKSQSIVDVLKQEMKTYNVTLLKQQSVKSIVFEGDYAKSVILENSDIVKAKTVIIACGGRAAPETGSSGDGYKWARKAGHTIEPLYPTEVPLTSNEPFIKEQTLMGLSLRDCELSVLDNKDKVVVTHRMDLLVTHFGFSGPAALRCAMFVQHILKKEQVKEVQMKLDVLPSASSIELIDQLNDAPRDKSIKNVLKLIVPERYVIFILDRLNIDNQTPIKQLHKNQLIKIVDSFKNFRFVVNGTLPIEKAFVTGGGVSVKEVYPKTMKSKFIDNLYFAGEILDINGYTGGYNITAAFSTGYVAGQNAAMQSFDISEENELK